MNNIVVFGATSAIAGAAARLWAARGAGFVLIARNPEKLAQVEKDLRARGARSVRSVVADLDEIECLDPVVGDAFSGGETPVDIILVAHGTLPEQGKADMDAEYAAKHFATNGANQIALLGRLAVHLERQRSGTLTVISSVAGDRGRSSNYLYGAAKAAVSTYCEGLRGRLRASNVRVLVIKPGFVDSPMTERLKRPGPLAAQPATIGADIVKAVDGSVATLYTPWFWQPIMFVIRHLPTTVLSRLKL